MATIEQIKKQLMNYFDNDASRVKSLAQGCEAIGFKIGDNLEAIGKHPEQFMLLITYSDMGVLGKLTDALNVLKNK